MTFGILAHPAAGSGWRSALTIALCAVAALADPVRGPDSPAALALAPEEGLLFVACATANEIAACNLATSEVAWRLPVPESPQGLALFGSRLYVTCAASASTICVIDVRTGRITESIPAGHTAIAPVLSPGGETLYVCNRFQNDVSFIDLSTRRETRRVKVVREPVAAAITPDGKMLVVANHLHAEPANTIHAAASVSLINTRDGGVTNVRLPEGSGLLRGVAISPDGRFAAVTHLRSMYWMTTKAVELGRMNGNALSFLDLQRQNWLGTILLDQTKRGAANPWSVAWLDDRKTIVVSHAGTHELSLVDAPLEADPSAFASMRLSAYEDPRATVSTPVRPVRLRARISLPGNGPRAIACSGTKVYVANYFSDDLCALELSDSETEPQLLSLRRFTPVAEARQGEMWFNDARLCAEGWQSCASCHDADARTDAFNWDLPNDGTGNPKNTKSLLRSHSTAPAMALGVRASAQVAVRAGLQHILFTNTTERVPAAIDTWLQTLEPIPSPYLANHRLSERALRGRALFSSAKAGCSACHPPPLFTDCRAYDVGSACKYEGMWDPAGADQPASKFDTPALLELWRTAPYLHDGSAATLREVLTTSNREERHGRTSHLTASELDDLLEFLLSL